MNRRSIMGLLGLAPVASVVAPSPLMSDAVTMPLGDSAACGPPPNSSADLLRAAYKAGLFPEAELRKAIVRERGWSAVPGQETIEGYKSISAVAKRRMIDKAREDDAWRRFLEGDPTTFWDLASKAGGLLKK
jgi:hypothetical protein